MSKLQNYHIEEYIFSYEAGQAEVVEYCAVNFLNNRINEIIKAGIRIGRHKVVDIDFDKSFFETWTNEDAFEYYASTWNNIDHSFPGYFKTHYFIALDKHYPQKIACQKLQILKTIQNQNFLKELNNVFTEDRKMLPETTAERVASHVVHYKEMRYKNEFTKYEDSVVFNYSLIRDLLALSKVEVLKKIDEYMNELGNHLMINKNSLQFHEDIIYESHDYSFKTNFSKDVNNKDLTLVANLIKYCQQKYIKTKNSVVKMDVDKNIQLMILDLSGEVKFDFEKADKLDNLGEDVCFVTAEDIKRKNRLRARRKRLKGILNQDKS